MNNILKIFAWNSNGLFQHHRELQVVLDTRKIDICLISETHFTKQSFIKINGYKVYHALHPNNTARGGSAILIKENLYHYQEMKFEEQEIQAVAVKIKSHRYEFSVVAIYSPPRHSIKKEYYLNFLEKIGNRFIIGGDFNAKNTYWGSRLTTTKGRELLSAIKELKCNVISTGKPTYWPTDKLKIPDLIDFFIYKNISSKYLHIGEMFDMNSDHSPILLTLSERIIYKESYPVLVNNKTDWVSFKTDLNNNINLNVRLKNLDQLNEEVRKFVLDIQQAAWNNTPKFRKKPQTVGAYPKDILELIAEKRKLRKKWHQSRSPLDKRVLNNLTKTVRKKIKSFNNSLTNSYLQNLTSERSTDYSLWKATKNIKRPFIHVPPIKEENGEWAMNNQQKAKRFAEYLEKIFQPNQGDPIDLATIETNQENTPIKFVTPKELQNTINKLNLKKTPGYDLITTEILRNFTRKAIVKLTTLINAAFRLTHVPDLWKVAEVIMIAKPGKSPNDVTSYRPISLLPIISKVFEKLLLSRLKPILEEKKLIPDHQFGFREKHSTIDQVHRITNLIEKSLEEKKVCTTVFLDVAQAFDKVWHEGLIHKLRVFLPPTFAKLLQSYISNRTFRVRQEDDYSNLKEIKAGVPQGSVLGPILYLLYTCDLPNLEYNTIATFADDTAIIAVGNNHQEAAEKVQIALNEIHKWTRKWRIKLNDSKSTHVDFTNKKPKYYPIYIDQHKIPHADTAKYLGMTLDTKLRWKAHVKKKREDLEIRYNKMYWLIGVNSELSTKNKILLYKQVLMPVWTYGIELWGCTKKSNSQIIQRFQNKVLRGIVNAPWYVRNEDIHRDLQMDFVDKVVKKHAESHDHRLHHHVNVEAIQLLDNTDLVRRLKRTKPFELV